MYKIIISLFFFIYFLTLVGCEDKSAYDDVIKKLKEQNKTIITKSQTQNINKQKVKNKTKKETKKVREIKKVEKVEENSSKETFVNKEEIKTKKKISNLTLKTSTDKLINLKFKDDGIVFEDYKDKIIILDIFTTWCPPCIESIPHLNQLQKQYKKKIQIIGILMEEDKKNSEVLAFKKKYHIKYPITNSRENFTLVDTWGGVSGYPTIIIFDKNGTYFNHFNGSPPIEMLESDIKKALRK
jgi:thiol-disulfide isomerase/thioredoxin